MLAQSTKAQGNCPLGKTIFTIFRMTLLLILWIFCGTFSAYRVTASLVKNPGYGPDSDLHFLSDSYLPIFIHLARKTYHSTAKNLIFPNMKNIQFIRRAKLLAQLHCFQLRTTLNGMNFKFVSPELWPEKQSILLQDMHKKEFLFFGPLASFSCLNYFLCMC